VADGALHARGGGLVFLRDGRVQHLAIYRFVIDDVNPFSLIVFKADLSVSLLA
jgi:hypothetical protein